MLGEIAPFLQFGAAGVLLAVVWYLLRQISSGEWVSRRELDYTRSDRDARLADKDVQISRADAVAAEWRAAYETSEGSRELLAEQVRDLASAVRAVEAFFDAFRAKVSGSPGQSRTGDDGP